MTNGFLAPSRNNAATLTAVILIHGAALTALALAKMDMPIREYFGPIEIIPIAIEPDPPEIIPEPQPQPRAAPRSDLMTPKRIVDAPSDSTVQAPEGEAGPIPFDPSPVGSDVVLNDGKGEPIVQPKPPVRVEAQVDRRYAGDLQPPYPPSEQRMSNEGKVTVRVKIGANGRVKRVARVSATSDAFFQATERHALRNWRFKPATFDGKAVESEKVMIVHFQMED